MFYCIVDAAGVHGWLWTGQDWVRVSEKLFECSDGTIDVSPDLSQKQKRYGEGLVDIPHVEMN